MTFNECLEVVLESEGGYSDHPLDGGGVTKYGITQATLSSWRGYKVTKEDVRTLSLREAGEIYKAKYWDKLRLDEVNNPIVRLLMFDFGVNAGIYRSATVMQALVEVYVDGRVGPITLKAINDGFSDLPREFFKKIQHHYVAIVVSRPSQLVFLKGWINRSHRLLNYLVAIS